MRTHSIAANKKGVSMIEMLGYVVLMGTVFTLLATTTFFIANTSRKMKDKSDLTVASTELYTQVLSAMNTISPDTITIDSGSDPDATTGTTVKFTKTKFYTTAGEDIVGIPNDSTYSITFSFNEEDSKMATTRESTNSTGGTGSYDGYIDLGTVNVLSFSFKKYTISKTISYVEFYGEIALKSGATTEYNFVVPVYTLVKIDGEVTP